MWLQNLYSHRRRRLPSSERALKCRETHRSSEQLFIIFVIVSTVHWDFSERPRDSSWRRSTLNALQVTCVLEVTRPLKETWVIHLHYEKMRLDMNSLALLQEPELTILKCEYCELTRSSFKWLLHLADDTTSHTVRSYYPGFFQSFCKPERAAI